MNRIPNRKFDSKSNLEASQVPTVEISLIITYLLVYTQVTERAEQHCLDMFINSK